MRKRHRKQRLAWLLTAALLLTHLPISVLSEELVETPIQAETVEQDEPKIAEEPNLPDFPTEETGEPTEPPVSEEPNETPEPSEPSGTTEIPADKDESEKPEPSDSDIVKWFEHGKRAGKTPLLPTNTRQACTVCPVMI